MTLIEAVGRFLGPIMAEHRRLFDGYPDVMPVIIKFCGREHRTTLGAFKEMDRAYADAFGRNQKAACRRRDRKAAGRLL